MSQSLQADPTTSNTLTLTCPLTGRSFSYDPSLPLELQAIPQELRFGFRPGAERGELWVLDMSILPASPDLPPLTRWEPPIEELVELMPGAPLEKVLKGRMSRSRADELCLERFGRTFKEERAYRREQVNESKRKNRFWCGLGACKRSSRRSGNDDANALTGRLNAR